MATLKSYHEREVLQQLAEGNQAAFVQIFDHYSPKVYKLAFKFLHSKEIAEEIVQDVFMDIWLKKEKMAEVLNFGGYVHGMAKKQVYDAFRHKSAFLEMLHEFSFLQQADNATEQILQRDDHEKLLQQAIEQLPDHQKAIFLLARDEGLSHEAIAQRMNLSRLAVKAHMKRILRFLRAKLSAVLKAETLFWLLLLSVR